MTGKNGGTYDLFSLIRSDRTDLAARRNNLYCVAYLDIQAAS
jgi:hypothetical protein